MKSALGMLKKKLLESLISVLPITLIVIVLACTPLLNLEPDELRRFITCSAFLVLGISLFNLGADLAMTPMGEQIGIGLSKTGKIKLLAFLCFIMGVLITISEPDLTVLATQVKEAINSWVLIIAVGLGVGLILIIAVNKIVRNNSLSPILIFSYMSLFALASLVVAKGNKDFLSVAFDSGGVTTGPITVPFLMALGVGIATTLGGKNASENSFGLIALCSIGPILAVMLLGIFTKGDMTYILPDYSMAAYIGDNFLGTVWNVFKDVIESLGLIVLFFVLLQIFILKLPLHKLKTMGMGLVYTLVGLIIFLTAATIGFMPVGFKIGTQIAGFSKEVLVILGLVIGMVVVLAEPAIHVLNKQVEDVTEGTVSKKKMMIALCAGVGISIALSMIRIIFDFSILYYVIPGYIISLGLSFFVPPLYTAIAFDSGGVASGPLTSTFILPMAVGACVTLQGTGSVMTDAFGVVAMVAMTPLISIQMLGFSAVAKKRVSERIAMRRILSRDDEQIIDFM